MVTDDSPNDTTDAEEEIKSRTKKLRKSCAALKGSLTRRAKDLHKMIEETGSRTKIKFLRDVFLEVYQATKETFGRISSLVDSPDYEWMEAVDSTASVCIAAVEEYFEARRDDPESTEGLTENWVRNHQPRLTAVLDDAPPLSAHHQPPPIHSTAAAAGPPYFVPRNDVVQPPPLYRNHVDSWIDDLDPNSGNNHQIPNNAPTNMNVWMIQQTLPRNKLPAFNGSAAMWVEFITKFRDQVHMQPYLSEFQKSTYLEQSLEGEAKRSIQGFRDHPHGYVLSLQRLKSLFGQRSRVAQAILSRVVSGPQVEFDGLSAFYYSISDCIITLQMLNLASELYSCHILRQTVMRLPTKLQNKWSEFSFSIRQRGEEPNLIHLERWVLDRVMAYRDMCPVTDVQNSPKVSKKQAPVNDSTFTA